MTPYSAIIRQLLINLGFGSVSSAWPVYVSFLPDTPDSSIAVYDTSGKFDARIMSGEQVEHPGIQVRIRGPVYPDVWNKTNAIALGLDAVSRVPVVISPSESYTVLNVSRTSPPLPMGVEEEGDRRRFNFTVNAVLTIEKGE